MAFEKPYNKPIIFILGGPGSGKGTQCERIVKEYGFCHMSTGDLLREEVNRGTARADHLKKTMADGKLVSQDVILGLVRDAMERNHRAKGFIIDGFPRDIPQGLTFERQIARCVCIMYFECTNEEMTKRLMGRAKTSGRVDDNAETIKKRLHTFEDQTKPVVKEWGRRVRTINAMRSVEEIYKDVQHHMWNLMMYHSQNFQYCKYY
jgi:adenylate kinase